LALSPSRESGPIASSRFPFALTRCNRTTGWNVCGATFQLGPKTGMTGPRITKSSAILCLSQHLAYLPHTATSSYPWGASLSRTNQKAIPVRSTMRAAFLLYRTLTVSSSSDFGRNRTGTAPAVPESDGREPWFPARTPSSASGSPP
jgi:hypothetical protein